MSKILELWGMYLDKAISDQSWHNDVSIVLVLGIAVLICFHVVWGWLGSDDEMHEYWTKQAKERIRAQKKTKNKR